MATPNITAHVVVEFSDGENPNVSVEVDTREDGYNHGVSSFVPGQDVYLLLYMPPGYICTYTEVTAGSLSYVSSTTVSEEEYLTFIDDEPANLAKYPISYPAFSWLGVNLGVVSVAKQICSLVARAYNAATGVYTPAHRIGLARAAYSTTAQVYRISSVPINILQVAALFVVAKAT